MSTDDRKQRKRAARKAAKRERVKAARERDARLLWAAAVAKSSTPSRDPGGDQPTGGE